MKHPMHPAFVALGAALLAGLQACASPTTGTRDDVRFPDPASAWVPEGSFPNRDNLRVLRTGMSKDQLVDLLGRPHFDEGLFGVRQWNYLFNFRTGPGPEFVTCQYQIRFDDRMRSESLHWKEPQCADHLRPPAPAVVAAAPTPAPVPATAAPVATPAKVIELAADALFRFDGGASEDLLPEGRQALDALAAQLRRDFASVQRLTVTGHTDRLGSDAYNDRLSLQRAQTVRDLLAQTGLPVADLQATGAGKREPVKTDCPGEAPTAELKRCLQPNRRVTVAVSGTRR